MKQSFIVETSKDVLDAIQIVRVFQGNGAQEIDYRYVFHTQSRMKKRKKFFVFALLVFSIPLSYANISRFSLVFSEASDCTFIV